MAVNFTPEQLAAIGAAIAQCAADADTNTWGDPQVAGEAGTDDFGNAYTAESTLLVTPDGERVCLDKAGFVIATEAGTGSDGTDYAAGDRLIDIPGVGLICLGDKDFDRIRTEGEIVPAGHTITYPDGTTETLATDYTVTAGEQYIIDDDEARCIPAKSLPPVEIPASAFADPEEPTPEEVNAFIAEDYPKAPVGQHFWYGGTQDASDYVYESDGDGTAHCVKSPGCKEPQIEIDPTVDPTDPTAVLQWIIDNDYGENADQVFYFVGDGSVQNPDYVWIGEGDGTITQTECPPGKEMCSNESAKGKTFPTIESLVNNGFYLERIWQESADDQCIPADPPESCAQIPQKTCSPWGQEFYWSAGGPWEVKKREPNTGFVPRDNGVAPSQTDAMLGAHPLRTWVELFKLEHTITNDDPCREKCFETTLSFSSLSFNQGTPINGVGNEWNIRLRGTGGFQQKNYKLDTTGVVARTDDPQDIFSSHVSTGVSEVVRRKLSPGESYTYGAMVDIQVRTYESNLLQNIRFGAMRFESGWTCV